tara:strand:+ start:106 stop:738 length:633 start_codon:yes stop_codon:yes gene_type:complete
MSSKEDGIIVILSSPSGAGKTTLVKILAEKKNFFISISHTTRNPRSNEINGKDYYFVNKKEFKLLNEKNEFLEHAEVFGHSYGTSKTPVIKKLNDGKNVLFDIDWQGTEQIIKRGLKYKLITFFILPPSKQVLFDRLSNRDMKDKLIVDERMREFNKDVLHWKNYDYVVINDDLDKCYKQISNLIDCEINKINKNYDPNIIKKHVDKLIT